MKTSVHPVINSILLLGAICFLFFFLMGSKKDTIVYVDNVELFSSFNMAKDLNLLHQDELQKQKDRVDSLVALMQSSPNEQTQQNFVSENNRLREMGEYFSGEVSQQVWTRLNSYMKDYGEVKGYEIILGTQGNGNLMFAKEAKDITEEFIQFANSKYEGK